MYINVIQLPATTNNIYTLPLSDCWKFGSGRNNFQRFTLVSPPGYACSIKLVTNTKYTLPATISPRLPCNIIYRIIMTNIIYNL